MERITTVAGLKSAIQILEVEQNARERLLKEQVRLAYESLKPINIFRNTLRELFTPSYLNENLAGTALGAASGFLLRKYFIGSSGGMVKKLLGKLVQFGITKLTARKTEVITSAGFSILSRFLQKRGWNPKARGN